MPVSSLRDLWRSKNRYFSSILGAVTSFSAATFTMTLGDSLGAHIEANALTGASLGFRSIFSTFILLATVFSLILSVITFTNLSATIMDNRAKDIAILKTSGGSIHKIYSHFMTQVIQLSFLIGGLSILVGILIYAGTFLITSFVTGFNLRFSIPSLELLGALAILVVFSVIFSHRHVAKTVRVPVAETFSPRVRDITLLMSEGWVERRISKPGSPLRVAFRNVRRTRPLALRLATCIFLSMILTASMTLGGVVGDQTTANYVNRAFSEDFIFVGHQEVWTQYSSLISFQPSTSSNSSFNYLKTQYLINASIVSQLTTLPGVVAVDPRLIYETKLHELKFTEITEENQYRIIGDNRSATVLVSGVEPERVISDWLVSGRFINSSDYTVPGAFSAIAIGDSVQAIFEDTTVQKGSIIGKEFAIAGTVLDPLASGWTVYMLREILSSLLGFAGYNMALIKCKPDNYTATLSLIRNQVAPYGLSAFSMRTTVLNLVNYVHTTWLVAFLPVILLLSTLTLGVISYMNLAFETGKRDFGIMRGVGASPKHIRRTIMMQGIIVSTWPGIAGIVAGLIVSYWFFMPAAIASTLSILASMVILLLLLFSASILASIISSRASRRPIIQIIR
jgi:ABC-type lipoprotein release transport system permease subunit